MSVHQPIRFLPLAAILVATLAHAQGASPPAPPAPTTAAPPATAPPAPPEGAPIETGPRQQGPVPYYQEQPEASPQIYVAQPPLPPIEPKNRHFHDGFYLRLSTGF